MKKILKWLLAIISAIVLIVVLGIISIIIFVNPNDFKVMLTDQIYQASGLRINFAGDMRLNLYPILGLEVNQVEVTQQNKNLAAIKRFVVGVELLPLLRKHIQISELYLDGADLNFELDAKGKLNWAIQPPAGISTAKTQPEHPADKKSTAITFFIPRIEASDTTVRWANRQNGQSITIKGINLSARNIAENTTSPVHLSFYVDSAKPKIQGPVSLNMIVKWSSSSKIVLDKIVLETKLVGKTLPENNITAVLKGRLLITDKQLVLKPLDLTLNQNYVTGAITVHDINAWDTEVDLKANPFGYGPVTAKEAMVKGRVAAAKDNPTLRSLNGSVQIAFKNGEYQGTNVLYFIDLGKSILQIARGEPSLKLPPLPTHMDRTSFGSLTGSGIIRQGILSNSDLVLNSQVLYATGSGTVNLVTQRINYRLKVSKADENDREKQNIPLIISGTLSDPDVSVDKGELLESVGKSLLKQTVTTLVPGAGNKGVMLEKVAKQFFGKF